MIALLVALSFAWGAEKSLPYLGPGSDKLSKTEYERIYKNYIQTSILLGYPFMQDAPDACEQALSALFRQAGFFSYPVPGDALQVQKSVRGGTETYELGGMLIQLDRSKQGAPERLFWVNSSSPKASRRLIPLAKKESLTLEKDKVTGLEKVKGIPVGYPHPYLNASGQGLFVRVVKFNGKKEGCLPTEFFDNAWNTGFDLSNSRCQELRADAEAVWSEKMKPDLFRDRELSRLKERSRKTAEEMGLKAEEAKKFVEKHFVPPYTSEINVVGAAMRNLAQCNILALGQKEAAKPAESAPSSGGSSQGAH